MMTATRVAVVVVSLPLLGGCALGWRAGAGLVVDTQGGVGLQATVGTSFGLALAEEHAVVITADAGIGAKISDYPFSMHAGAGCGYVYADGIGFRLNLLANYGGEFGKRSRVTVSFGLAAAWIDQLKEGGFGGEIQGLFVRAGVDQDDSEVFGQFVLSAIYEYTMISPFRYRHPH